MRRLTALVSLLAIGFAMVGCGTGEVSNKDQADKMSALHDAEKDSQAKDGVKSE